MHFQKHEHYGLLLMGELAGNGGSLPISLSQVSRRHGVSRAFLKKIVRSLRASNLVKSKEGIGGGYTLTRKPESISLWEILCAFNSDEKTKSSVCPLNTSCLPQQIRSLVFESIKERLTLITLKEATQ